jgi:hypothetical protein
MFYVKESGGSQISKGQNRANGSQKTARTFAPKRTSKTQPFMAHCIQRGF